jgi:uncharacterized protein (TIGR01777 family)
MKKILLFGGSGFIGKHLIEELYKDYEINVPSRNPENIPQQLLEKVKAVPLDLNNAMPLVPIFEKTDYVINLSGESVDGKWTEAKKTAILESRLTIDKLIIAAFEQATKKPETIIQGSGIGYYGMAKIDDPVTVEYKSLSNSFLTDVALQHEAILDELILQTRVIFIRTGIVLDKNEGGLPKMTMPLSFFAGKLGDGKQWMPWIHIKDEVRAIRYLLENNDCEGPYNLTAPNPVRQEDFVEALGEALDKRPFFPVPAFMLKVMLGEMADELLLNGMKVVPERLMKTGFKFQFETIEKALRNIYT